MKVSTVLSVAAMAVAGAQADGSFSDEDQAICIDRHNYFRSTGLPWSAGNMRRIGWDANLATTAATSASGCSATTAAGLNVYTSSLNSTSILDEAIQSWVVDTSLSTLASLSQPSTGDAVGAGVYNSYSQVVWATTYSVGCATATCSSGEMVVCAYSPAGNDGSSGWYVYADQASQCPEGTTASDGLCIVDGDAANNAIAGIPAGKSTAEVYPTYITDIQAAIVGGGATGSASGSSSVSIAGSTSSSTAGSTAGSPTGSTGESTTTTTPSVMTATPSTASSTGGSTTTTAPSTTTPAPSTTTATPSTTTIVPSSTTTVPTSSTSKAPSSTSKAPTSSTTKSTTTKPSTTSATDLSSSSSSKETSTTKKTSKTTTSSSSDSTTSKADSSSPGTVKASSASGSSFKNQASSSGTTTSESSTTTTAPSTGSTTTAGSTTGVSANNASSSKAHGISTLGMVSVIVLGVVAVAAVSMFVNYRLSQQRQRDIMLDGGI